MTRFTRAAILIAVALTGGVCLAQTNDPARFYKLDFVVKELEAGKVLTSHAYSMRVSTDGSAGNNSIRTGSKVPIQATQGAGSINFIDVGVNIDCRIVKQAPNDQLTMYVSADVSSMVQDSSNPSQYPIIRQNRWSSSTVMPLRKSTVIFSSDDNTGKRQMQLEVTATPIP